ncbi:hypothetical protein TSAR_003776 [Trichomalopsis sarcophagae]|uniref:Uncharacterized protein n=1 Tax=Trichomalopsis sarcophagae TaxID=543379 RepID=A0A232FI42_9HYME|nr:hypothetical protein TSAR_003776 [Trichomalopsis sarcophagae]
MGCSIFLPWCVYYFSSHQHRKCTFPSRRPGFARDMNCPSFFLPRHVIYYL